MIQYIFIKIVFIKIKKKNLQEISLESEVIEVIVLKKKEIPF